MTGIITYFKSRRPLAAGTIALLLLGLALMTLPALTGDGGSLMAQTSDAISRFIGRSPGERGETDLIKTKIKRGKGKTGDKLLTAAPRSQAGEPEERALGKIFDTPPEEAILRLTGSPLGPLALGDIDPSDFAPLGGGGNVGGRSSGPGSGFPGGISTVVPPGGSVDPGNPTTPTEPGTPTTPTNPANPVGAVPEPESWALMLLGFGLCGAALRRRRQKLLGKPGIA